MERKNDIIITLLLVFFLSGGAFASNKEKIYQAYISNRMDDWKVIIDSLEQNKTENADYLSELVNFQYGYIGYCLGADKDKEAKDYLYLAESNLEILENKNYNPALINAYKAAFWGFKIGLSPIKAPILGPRSIKNVDQALEINNKLPFAHVQYGNAYFYMPAVFGGSKQIAIEHFLLAIEQMEASPEELANDWNYLSLLSLTGQSYEKVGEYDKAKNIYEKALKFEPNFKWIRDELYPDLKTKLKK
ncbi:tetratricopeptide repeat protein [uncultured Draconibacterium sp.]|uniref:tetratricopeptide repeat protein n=1 Tax=uncultured Draconibacterium sp. TaxID=1573823 RepID=UPI0029C8E442|nr:tetratricopeptide repeat protein [uncultured Draconibacterium sp.]